MRELSQTRHGLNAPQPSTSVSFRLNNQEKDESLAAIMERRRRIADAEKGVETDESVAIKTFSPRSNRMKRRESIGSTGGMTNVSNDTPTNMSVESPPAALPSTPPKETLNELQMAMFKRRSKVDDTTLPIVSPRQKRRSEASKHIPMSPALQEKLQKQMHRAEMSSPMNSISAKTSASLQQRLAANKIDSPKVSLSILPSPIPSSPIRNSNESIDSDDRSRFSAATSRSGSATERTPRLPPSLISNLDDDDVKQENIKIEEEAEEEEIIVEEEGDDDYEEEVVFVDEGDETETSILYADTDNDDSFLRSDDDDGACTSDDGINLGSRISSSVDEYYFTDDYSSKTPSYSNGSRLQQSTAPRRQRRPERRPRRKPNANTNASTNNDMNVDPDESGPTYYEGSNSNNNYPVASDTESECDPLTSFDRADKFAKSDSFYNDSIINNDLAIDSSENGDEKNNYHQYSHKAVEINGITINNEVVKEGGSGDVGVSTSSDGNKFVEGESDDEMMILYASTSTDGPMDDEQTVDESILMNDNEEATDDFVENNKADDLLQFVKERSNREFNDFGDYVEEEVEVAFHETRPDDVERQESGRTSLFSSIDTSDHPKSLSSKSKISNKEETAYGGTSIDGRVDREVPIGGDDDNDSNSTATNQHRRSSKQTANYVRVCSRPMIIALILVGSVVIGICIGLFVFSGNDTPSTNKAIPVLPIVNASKPVVDDPNRSKIPPEQLPTYDVICPLLIDCNTLTDAESPSRMAFDWLVNNQTANPELDSMQNTTKIQRYALATVYYSTGGDSWVDKTNWLSGNDTCDWFSSTDSGSGCGIEDQTSFTVFQLDNNNVKGELPFELSLLTDLKEISIRNPAGTDQYLKGIIPSSIGKLTSLTTLVLSGNQFSSGIPTEFGLCTNLNMMDLSSNGLNGEIPTALSALTNLTTLYLEGNFFAGSIDPTVFDGTKSLVDMNLEGNQFTGLPESITTLTKINTLLLGSNSFSTFPLAITQLSTLTILDLSGNRILQGIPPQLGRMTTLQQLDLSRNEFTGMVPVEIGNLVNLDLLLDLSFNTLTGSIPSRIGQLIQLRRLRLDGNRLSGAIPTTLASLSKIEEIRLDDNNFIGTIPVEVCTLYNTLKPASYADCNELQNTTCITHCCTGNSKCVCQFEKTDPLLCIKDLQ